MLKYVRRLFNRSGPLQHSKRKYKIHTSTVKENRKVSITLAARGRVKLDFHNNTLKRMRLCRVRCFRGRQAVW